MNKEFAQAILANCTTRIVLRPMRTLCYKLCKDRNKQPLVVLESPLGNGQEISPDALRRLAECLNRIAEEAEKVDRFPHQSSAEY